jgi:glycosyltransferase involved in cell wall biosynthesis
MSVPTISVLMPVYNAELYLAEAVESILAQTFGDFEFLIVDDGSTDGSPAILRRYAERDSRIALVSRPNTGYLVALNEMIGRARGEFLARMDADDVAMQERFERQVAYFRVHPEAVALGGAIALIAPDGGQLDVWYGDGLSHDQIESAHLSADQGSAICHPSVMMRAKDVRAVGGYRPEYYTAEDLDLFLRLAERGRLVTLPRVLLRYRQHPQSIGHLQSSKQRERSRAAVAAARRRRGLPERSAPDEAVQKPPVEVDHVRKWAWWALGAGNVATARRLAVQVVLQTPMSVESWRLLACVLRGY